MAKKRKLSAAPRKGSTVAKRKPRNTKNKVVTSTGRLLKTHKGLVQRFKASKEAKSRRKAAALSTLPENRFLRVLARFHPKRMFRYWFSRDGVLMALKLTGASIVVGFLILVGLFAYFRKDLPNLRDISGNNIGGSTRYFDRTGEILLWEDYDSVKRIPVEFEQMAENIRDATIAVEDQDFYEHGGFDLRGITRAAWNNTFGGGDSLQGGSTITQQLVKLTQDWTADRSYTRKIKELILSVELERSFTKDEILAGYLNTAPYGGLEYGVEAASRSYFDKTAAELTVAESAFLAAIPQSPTFYSPYSALFDEELLVGRSNFVVNNMYNLGMITEQERDEALGTDIVAAIQPRRAKFDGIQAPWFVLAAKEQLERDYFADTANVGGWKVITTLDMDLQNIAEEEVADGLGQIQRQGGNLAAFVASDVKTGQVVSLVGGSDFNNEVYGQNNYARLRLPPGSSIKPYDYAALIETQDNFGAGSVLYDDLGPLPGYPCTNQSRSGNCLQNYDFREPGALTLRYALGGSRNIPAVKAMLIAGIDETITLAESLGLESGYKCFADEEQTEETQCFGSAGIGDGAYLRLDEHVHAYSTLSNNGRKLPQTYILKIEDSSGRTIDEWQPSQGEQVISDETAYIVSDMLADPRASYFSRKAHDYAGHDFSLKTGTTNDSKDGWLLGYSTHYAAGVWVGHNDRNEMTGFMENMTRPIWEGWMQRAHDNKDPEPRVRPSGIQELPAYVVRTHVGVGSIEPSPSTDLYPSWYNNPAARNSNEERIIDRVSKKRATECTPERAKQQVNEGDASLFSGDIFVDATDADLDATDDVHQCSDALPSITITNAPATCDGTCSITVNIVSGTHPITSEEFPGILIVSANGQELGRFDVASNGVKSASFTLTGSGTDTTVTATVVDSVLYDASDTVVITAGTAAVSPLSLSWDGDTGPDHDFSWSSVSDVVSYEICYDRAGGDLGDGCQTFTAGATSGTIGPLITGDYTAVLTATTDDEVITSNTVSFSE